MGIGPFTTYAPPGVYTQTITEPIVGQLLSGLRIPVLIGVAQETLSQTDFEIIRGSSSVADTPIFNEDATGRWVTGGTPQNPRLGDQNGSYSQFQVRNYPIVDGSGMGKTTFDTTKVSVTVNGQQVVVSAVNGTYGLVSILVPTQPTDVVLVSYNFHRGDTRITDILTAQVSPGPAVLVAPSPETYNIVQGVNDVLQVTINDGTTVNITLTPGPTQSATQVANDINNFGAPGLSASVHVDNQGLNHVQLIAQGNVLIGNGTATGTLGFNPGAYTNRNKVFRTFNGPIVDGSGGGITTTDPSKVVVLVNGLQVIASAVDGANQAVTLPFAPSAGATVTIQYFFNTFQDTFDYLPNNNIVTVGNVGIAPGRLDYLNGPDFVILNEGDQSLIQWGTAFLINAGLTTGVTPFNNVQMIGLLVDDRIFGVPCTRFTNTTTNQVSTTTFVMPLTPTTGNGRDTPLGVSLYQTVTNGRIDLPTNRPDLVTVYVGKTWRDAFSRPPVTVLSVDSATNTFVLANPVPADYQAFATFWYNRIEDDTITATVVTPGPSGAGQFTLTSQLQNNAPLFGIRFGTKSALPQIVQWPSGSETVPDAITYGGTPVPETVTVQFSNTLDPATHASVSNGSPSPYDVYEASRIFGGVIVDGNPSVSVDLSTAYPAELLSQPINNPGALSFLSTDYLVIRVDGIIIAPISLSGLTTLAQVVTAINAAVDADVQVHPDGSPTFAFTHPNNLASAVTYAAQSILKIAGRNVLSSTNGLVSNVLIMSPTAPGQTDGSPKLNFTANQTSSGSYNALDQAAFQIGTRQAPFNITALLNDNFQFSIDGTNYSATLPDGIAVALADVVAYINAGYAANASAADQATLTASLVVLANSLKLEYNNHISNTGGVFHAVVDTFNAVTAPNATNLPSALTLLNQFITKYDDHISNTGGAFHSSPDTVNVVTDSPAVDLRSALILAQDEKRLYNFHRVYDSIHALNDTVNIVVVEATELVAQQGQGINAGYVMLVSRTNTSQSSVIIDLGTANAVLGFVSGSSAFRHQPAASDIANALNFNGSFSALAVAYSIQAPGLGTYLEINSLTAGSTSTLSFTSVANTVFIPDTGIGIVPGVTGNSGEAAQSGYTVTSTNPNGSSGFGFPGQTYTDARTGLRFTVLPASAGDYSSGGSFTLIVNSTFTCNASIPFKSIPGLELTVYNTLGMNTGDTGIIQTFAPGGTQPAVGDVYYVSYQYAKSDLTPALYQDAKTIQAAFGPPTPQFPLSLGARLSILNGAVIVGLAQVLKAPGSSQASVGSFTAAIDSLRKPFPGNIKPDIITPLGTDPAIFSYLNQHCIIMSSPRQQGERMGVVGVAAGTNALGVTSIAQGLGSELMVVVYPESYVIPIQDNLGNITSQLVDGSYMAAALAGTTCAPSIDVATPWTRRSVLGFTSPGRTLDPTEANQVAVNGVTVIEMVQTGPRVRHGLTTNPSTVITRTPSVTLTIQYVQQDVRTTLDPFIGQKFTGTLLKTAERALTAMFATLIDNQIVSSVSGIDATVDPNDPTIMRTESIYVPVFPLEYIVSTLQVRISG
jgi:hypothetical protein